MKTVVSGYGIIAPKTKNIDEFLYNLQNGVNTLELVENAGYRNESNIVGMLHNGLEELEIERKIARLPKVSKMGILAGREALKSASIDLKGRKAGIFFGISLGASIDPLALEGVVHTHNEEYKKLSILFSHYVNYHSITSSIAHFLDVKGVAKTISTGCTSSLEAIEEAILYLKAGKIDVAIVGGAESPINKMATYAFSKTRMLPLNQGMDVGAVPFHKDSKGFAISEGSGVIVLEREEDALHRGAPIKGEIVDVLSNNDGVHIFDSDESGEQMLTVLKEITRGRSPDYVNSQALGIQHNDRIEEKCSKRLFNHQVPYTSIKSMYGNPFGAMGVLQVISSLLSMEHSFIPPTIRTVKKGYEDMNIVTETKYQNINEVVVTSHGHGGNNACAYIKKHKRNKQAMECKN